MDQKCINPRPSNGASVVSTVVIIALLIIAGIAVIIMVLSILCPNPGFSKISRAKTEINNLALCIGAYKNDCGVYPDDTSSETVINALTGYKSSPDIPDESFANDPDWKGPYLQTQAKQHELGMKNKALIDPWHQPYQFKLRKPIHNIGGIDIWSLGPDMQEGGGDDISNWKESTAEIPRELKTIIVVSGCLIVIVIVSCFGRTSSQNDETCIIQRFSNAVRPSIIKDEQGKGNDISNWR